MDTTGGTGDEADHDSGGSADGTSDNDQDGPMEERDDEDMDGSGAPEAEADGEGEAEEEIEEDEDEQDEQLKPAEISQASSMSRSDSQQGPNGLDPPALTAPTSHPNPSVSLASPLLMQGSRVSTNIGMEIPKLRPEVVMASVYDIVPTIAAPHSTSINSITATPDLRWVFTGGADGYIRKFNWLDTANGKSMLTVAQRHPFVDSVNKAGVLMSYWDNTDESSGNVILFSG